MLDNYPSTKDAADAVKELTIDYRDKYGFKDVVGNVVFDKESGVYTLALTLEGNRGIIQAQIQANRYQVEDIDAARSLIPKLHTKFMELMYRTVVNHIW